MTLFIFLYLKNAFFGGKFYILHYFKSWCKPNIDKSRDGIELHILYINIKKDS